MRRALSTNCICLTGLCLSLSSFSVLSWKKREKEREKAQVTGRLRQQNQPSSLLSPTKVNHQSHPPNRFLEKG
ncbi:hypothetical protein VNO77_38952 [Canavalia gladiata]|uniref:Secreted protein n=1 Tax=Canavalia gladiata TaxID=3824 RepID=A0AAN9KBC2_CANGL